MRYALLAAPMLLVLTGCEPKGDAKTAWNDVIKRCGQSDLNGKSIVFFGPSQAVGPGSVWRKDSAGVYQVRFDVKNMPKPQDFLASYAPFTCDGGYTSDFKFGLTAGFEAPTLNANLAADFGKAKKIEAKAESVAWVPIAEASYEDYLKRPTSERVMRDLTEKNRFVLTRAFLVHGFTTKMEFSDNDGASLKAKLPDGALSNVAGSVEAGLTASWSGTSTLTITSREDFYIAGEYHSFDATGFASSTGSPFGAIPAIPADVKIGRDPPSTF